MIGLGTGTSKSLQELSVEATAVRQVKDAGAIGRVAAVDVVRSGQILHTF